MEFVITLAVGASTILAALWVAYFSPSALAAAKKVRWEIARQDSEIFLLRNVGDKKAQAVKVTGLPGSRLNLMAPEATDVNPGEAFEFVAAVMLTTSNTNILVSWNEGKRQHSKSWQHPLPR